MKQIRPDNLPTQVNAIESDVSIKSNGTQAIKRLRLTTPNEQLPPSESFEVNLNSFTELRLEMNNARINLPAMINEIFDLVNQFFSFFSMSNVRNTANVSSDSTTSSPDSFLNFIMLKLDFLMEKIRTNSLPEYKLESITKLLLQLLVKYFQPSQLKMFYSRFFDYLKQTKNNKLIVELLSIWAVETETVNLNEIKEALLPFLKRNLRNDDHRIRSKCIKILAFNYSDHEAFADNKLMKIILNFTEDQDPRVRATSLKSMIRLHLNGKHMSTNNYDDLNQHLNDDYEQVRLLAIEAITHLAVTYPEFQVKVATNEEEDQLRLIDDVFAKLCLMINDISVEVKVCANSSMAKLNGVSPRFLLQTLDKNIMNDLKSKKFKQRAKQLASSEWSSDSTITEEDNLNLMASGACGAFIHGLEDECLEVRGESVDALCQLSINCPELASTAIDFLVDMFNDEIESVRLKAIVALTKIAHYVLLGDDQVDIVLSVIEDGSLEVREALKTLLSSCKLATKIGLKKATQALFTNLRKYSFDKYSIWKCFKNLGLNHSKFVMSLVSYLIGLHPFLDVTEPDMNDHFYTSSLILIYNGVYKNSAILPLLPKFVINHYFFLKLKLPDLVPSINLIDNFPITLDSHLIDNEIIEKNKRIERFFLNTINNLKISNHSNNSIESTITLLESIGKDMVYLSDIDPSTSVACEIMKTFVDCYLIIKKTESDRYQSSIDCNKLIQIEEALVLAIKLLVLYKGYNFKEKIILHQLYLFLRAFYLKELYNIKMSLNANSLSHNNIVNSYLKKNFFKQDLIKECRLYLSFIKLFDTIANKYSNKLISSVINNMSYYESNPLNIIELLNTSLFNDFNLNLLILNEKPDNYVKVSLDLIEPVENLETPIRYTPGLICNLRVNAVLSYFTRFDNLCIQIRYSDNDKQFLPIELSSIKKISSTKHLLDTHINLSNLAWTDVCYVKICISMLIDEVNDFEDSMLELLNKDEEDCVHQKSITATAAAPVMITSGAERNLKQKTFKNQCDSIELSNVVKVYFEPSLVKKFI